MKEPQRDRERERERGGGETEIETRQRQRDRDRDRERQRDCVKWIPWVGCGLNEARVAFALGLSFCFDQSSGEQT